MKLTIALTIMVLSVLARAEGPERLRIQDFYGIGDSIYRWERVPVLFGKARISAIHSNQPLISCERVFNASQEASALLTRTFQEQEKLSRLLEDLEQASPQEIEELLHKVRQAAHLIETLQQQLLELYPPEFQQKDRVRTLTWTLENSDFAILGQFPRIPTVEWAQLEVISGEGGWFGAFAGQNGHERPMRERFEALIAGYRDPAAREAVRKEFGYLLQSIQHFFAAGTPGARGARDWQGSRHIRLVQELSPVEACVPHVHLTSALLLDFAPEGPDHYRNPRYPYHEKKYRLGMGPVILTYHAITR